jgi:RNA-splicing ligase RtcB
MEETWGSTAQGAGHTMSRAQTKRRVWGETLLKEMEARGIIVRAACISRKVVSLTPTGNIKCRATVTKSYGRAL